MNQLSEGTKVKLKDSVQHSCPEGREDNKESVVAAVVNEMGGVRVYPELAGCSFWNKEHLEVVEG